MLIRLNIKYEKNRSLVNKQFGKYVEVGKKCQVNQSNYRKYSQRMRSNYAKINSLIDNRYKQLKGNNKRVLHLMETVKEVFGKSSNLSLASQCRNCGEYFIYDISSYDCETCHEVTEQEYKARNEVGHAKGNFTLSYLK